MTSMRQHSLRPHALLLVLVSLGMLLGCARPGAAQLPSPGASAGLETTPDPTRSAPPAAVPSSPTFARSTATATPVATRKASATIAASPTAPRATSTSTRSASATPVARASTASTPFGTPTPVAQRLRGPGSVPPSPRYEPLPLVRDAALEDRIRKQLGTNIGDYGVVVKRLSDGRGVTIDADREFYAASIFKIFVMYEVFKQRDEGFLRFDDLLTVTPPYQQFQLGDLAWPLWTNVSIRELLEAMITVSDNVAAMMLYDKTAGWNITRDLKSSGLSHTSLDSQELPTSAGDLAILLEMIARGKAVSQGTSQEMIDLLSRQKVNDRLPALLPPGTRVAHKTGNWDNATHDAGIVFAPGGAYVIVVLSDRAWDPEPIAALSKLVYDYFEGESKAP